MSREIKYRQKLKSRIAEISGNAFHYWGYIDGGFVSPIGKNDVEGDDDQYTGLKDKNGVEIYEGDIVKQEVNVNTEFHGSYALYEILFNNGGFLLSYLKSETGFKLARGYTACFLNDIEDISMKLMLWSREPMEMSGLELIGNIHQNPELLEQSND